MLSVIIPTFNSAETLRGQLKALRAQDYTGTWELLVINNRSTDNTCVVVEEFCKTMPNLRLIPALEKQSKGYALNVGARAASGDTFVFCDADDQAAANWLTSMAKALEKHDFVVGNIEVKTLNPSSHSEQRYGNNGLNDPLLNFWPYAIGANNGCSRKAFERAGGFREKLLKAQDVDFSWRLKLLGYTLHHEPNAIMYYRYRSSPWDMWKASVAFSSAHALLYKRYAAYGMPRPSPREVYDRYVNLFYNIRLHLVNRHEVGPSQRVGLAQKAGICIGRVLGSLRYTTLYP